MRREWISISKKHKITTLIIAMLVAFCIGAWLIASPAIEKQRKLTRQNELLKNISQSGVIVLDESSITDEVGFYDSYVDIQVEEVASLANDPAAQKVSPTEAVPTATEIVGTGILYIDSIDAVLPVTDGVSSVQLEVAVGHVPQTAPIGSEGNAVIAGHRSYSYGQDFNRLGELVEGDLIRYEDISGMSFTYKVFETLEILPDDTSAFEQPKDEYILTLYTCTPIYTATHRLLVRAELVNQTTTEEESN